MRAQRVVVVAAMLALGASASSGQPVVPACNMQCGTPQLCNPLDSACQQYNTAVAECQLKQADCQAKYVAYDAYLTQMGLGVQLLGLPLLYRQVLAPFYPNANLAEVRFGMSNRQPEGNATCDCDRIYFNSPSYVQRLQAGTLAYDEDDAGFGWLLHELRHFEQCRELGSRDAYAKMWWDHMTASDFQALIETGQWQSIHEQMQMENDAKARRDQVLNQLRTCCIHPSTGRLVAPLTVAVMQQQPAAAKEKQPVSLSVQSSGGADPLVFKWSVQRPGGGFEPLSSNGTSAQFVPDVPGQWQVRLSVVQADGASGVLNNNHEEVRPVSVEAVPPVVAGISLSSNPVVGGASLTGGVQVTALNPGQTVDVALSTSHPSVGVPASVSVTAGSNGTGSANFPITTQLVVATVNVNVSGALGAATSSAQLTVHGVTVEAIKFDATDALAGQLVEIELMLDRPPPVTLTVVLESSDRAAFNVPTEVVFRAGEQRKTVPVRVGESLSRELAVTVRARTAMESRASRSQELRLRPVRQDDR